MTPIGGVPLLVTTTVAVLTTMGGVVGGAVVAHYWQIRARRRRSLTAGAGSDHDAKELEQTVAPAIRPAGTGDARINRALDALPLGVLVTDPEGRVIYRNRFAEQFQGARHGDALVEAELQQVISAAATGTTLERSVEIYGPPARSLQLRGSPTYDGDVQTGSVVVVEDVTAAQQVDRIRKDFVANVSHELRTPIGAIGVLAETLRDADDPEIVDRLAGRLQNEAIRLGDMIGDLLALSTLESGVVDEPHLVDLNEVIQAALERSAGAAEHREITIRRTAACDGPVFVDGDQSQMAAAVANLVDNAIKYSGAGGEVEVAVARGEGDAVIRVIDTGVGIPEADLDRIFERFYRVDGARSRVTGGTGLGLSIVRHVAINHRGTIEVTSEEGSGSTFTLTLPLSAVHGPSRQAGPGLEGTPGARKEPAGG